ncbi:MAG: class I SAM-dependent methyltransferase [Azonexus sp.]|nr:class I SAM-dependent methyltransferase [Azonexus sp.]
MKNLQSNYTDNPVASKHMYDSRERSKKADKIIAVLTDYFSSTRTLSLLDASCSTGLITSQFSSCFAKVVGIDIDEKAVLFAKSNNDAHNVGYYTMNALATSFEDATFDVVICNQMYEHVPDAARLLVEIRRILKPGGVCYFGATNRLKIMETHYGRLPFLSYFPKSVANIYLKLMGRGNYYYENLYPYWKLKKLCKDFEVIDYTKHIVEDPEKYGADDVLLRGTFTRWLAGFVLNYAYWACPGYVWLLRRPGDLGVNERQ